MTTATENPIRIDPAFSAAREVVASGALGQLLAVYAVARAREPLEDPLRRLGAPLIDELTKTAGWPAVSVTATRSVDDSGFEHWSMVIALKSGLRASLDIGAGIGQGQVDPLDLRVEWSGSERIVLVEPGAVSICVITGSGTRRRSAEVHPLFDASRGLSFDEVETGDAAKIIAAARRSAETRQRIALE